MSQAQTFACKHCDRVFNTLNGLSPIRDESEWSVYNSVKSVWLLQSIVGLLEWRKKNDYEVIGIERLDMPNSQRFTETNNEGC